MSGTRHCWTAYSGARPVDLGPVPASLPGPLSSRIIGSAGLVLEVWRLWPAGLVGGGAREGQG